MKYIIFLSLPFFFTCNFEKKRCKENVSTETKTKKQISNYPSLENKKAKSGEQDLVANDSLKSLSFLGLYSDTTEKQTIYCDNNIYELRVYKILDFYNIDFSRKDPVLNVILASFDSNRLIFHEIIGTSDQKDISIVSSASKECIAVIQQYSSAVGWHQYFVLDFNEMFLYETRRFDESEIVDLKNMDLTNNTYFVVDKGKEGFKDKRRLVD